MKFEIAITLIGICRAVTMLAGFVVAACVFSVAIDDGDASWRSLLAGVVGIGLILIGVFA